MSWIAQRWTAKTPSELFHTLGPHGVGELVHQMVSACWRSLPSDDRPFSAGVAAVRAIYDRNVAAWKKIKKPSPEAFFADMGPTDADGYCRQAMVLTWMMMPRRGGREIAEALKIFGHIVERTLENWAEDAGTFGGKAKAKRTRASKTATPVSRPAGRKAASRPRARPLGKPSVRGATPAKTGSIKKRTRPGR